jgi:hypothetical protein
MQEGIKGVAMTRMRSVLMELPNGKLVFVGGARTYRAAIAMAVRAIKGNLYKQRYRLLFDGSTSGLRSDVTAL